MDEQLLKELLALAEDPDYQAASEGLKAKIAKLIMMAKGGDAVPPSAPEDAALAVDPMADPKDKKDEYAMRRAVIDARLRRAEADAAAIERGAFLARLGSEIQLTVDQEKKIAAMHVDAARAYADGLKDAGAAKPITPGVSLRLGPADEPRGEQAEPSLAISELGETDESVKKMSPALLSMRRQMARENPSGWKLAVIRAGGN